MFTKVTSHRKFICQITNEVGKAKRGTLTPPPFPRFRLPALTSSAPSLRLVEPPVLAGCLLLFFNLSTSLSQCCMPRDFYQEFDGEFFGNEDAYDQVKGCAVQTRVKMAVHNKTLDWNVSSRCSR